ncbi:MAG: hypothetical protein K0Q92_1620 [Steroidobacteraceae bacterium]|jgi:hypothetical protein|nr:hypothetical protein [Steroidobacteraceae bacterium]
MTTRKVKRLDELAHSVPPPRDLWPAIHAEIEAREKQPGSRRTWWMPAVGMAAAMALVSIGVIIGIKVGGESSITLASDSQNGGDAAMIPAALRDANYRKQRDALLVEVNSRLKTMPEEDRAKVAASLKTLQRSISDIEAALGRDPANALLQELLVNSCQEEMRVLTTVRDSGSQET